MEQKASLLCVRSIYYHYRYGVLAGWKHSLATASSTVRRPRRRCQPCKRPRVGFQVPSPEVRVWAPLTVEQNLARDPWIASIFCASLEPLGYLCNSAKRHKGGAMNMRQRAATMSTGNELVKCECVRGTYEYS